MPRGRARRPSRLYKESRRFLVEARQLGHRIRQLRQEKGWTLEDAADRMHIDLKHLQKVESADPPHNATLVTLLRIADGFAEPIGSLFTTVAHSETKRATTNPRSRGHSLATRRR